MKMYIPNSVWLGNIDPFLRSFDTSNSHRLEISTHKQWISIHPVVLSMVAALGLDHKPEILLEKLEAKSKHYLERIGLFKLLKVKSGIKVVAHEPSGRFIPLTQIKETEKLDTFIEDIIPLLHLEPKQAQPIRYIVSELVRNVFEHSESKIGAILCAQYYKKSNTIRLGIVDRGVGIKQTISNSYPTTKNDVDAIKLALTPGITGTTKRIGGTAQNVGAGLFFIKTIAKTNRDFFMIYSGKGMYKLLKTNTKQQVRLYANPQRDKHSTSNRFPFWQGTAIGIDLNLDSREEFNDLLNAIYFVFQKTVRVRRKEYYKKKARFI